MLLTSNRYVLHRVADNAHKQDPLEQGANTPLGHVASNRFNNFGVLSRIERWIGEAGKTLQPTHDRVHFTIQSSHQLSGFVSLP